MPSLYLLFGLSGFSALVYQIAWQRMLGFFGGSDSISATTTVGAFLLGLGLGSLLAGTFADRLSDRGAIFGFAACEMGIAAFAVVSKFLLYDFLFGYLTVIADSRWLVFLVAFLALLVPTILMGFSLPLLARAVVSSIWSASKQIGWLYGVNTMGAGIGAFTAGFFMVGNMGYEATLNVTALLNTLVGVGALILASSFHTGESTANLPVVSCARVTAVPARVWQWSFLVFVSGFIIISLEIVWFRVIGNLLQSTAYNFALVLGCFLIGDALGIIAGAYTSQRITSPYRFFLWLQGVVTLYAITALWLLAQAYDWTSVSGLFIDAVDRPRLGNIALVFAAVILIVVPPAFLLGTSFPITQKAIQDDPALVGQRVGLIQLANILGNTAGSILTGLILLHYLGTSGTVRLLAVLGLLFTAALLLEGTRQAVSRKVLLSHAGLAAGLALVLVTFPSGLDFWSRLHATKPGERVLLREDRTGVALLRHTDKTNTAALYIGGHQQSNVPFHVMHGTLGFLGVLVHPDPKTVLVVGHGAGGTPYGAGVNPSVKTVRVVEIVEPVYRVMEHYRYLVRRVAVDRVLSDERYERWVGDARHVLLTTPERYDVVEADAMYPRTSNSGMLYSIEYFRQVRARLRPEGIAVQWAPTPRVVNSFLAVFPHVVQLTDLRILLGSDRPINFDLEALKKRFQDPAVRTALEAAEWNIDAIVKFIGTSQVKVWQPNSVRPQGDVNTDLFPRDEFYLNRAR
jgi:spermidine synthase